MGAYEEEVVVLGLAAKVLEDAVLPELLHVGPVLDLAVAHGHGDLVDLGVLVSLVTDEEVQIGDVLAGSARGTTSGGRGSGGLLGDALGGDGRGDDVLRLSVAGIAHLGVAGTIVDHDGGKSRSAHFFFKPSTTSFECWD